MSDLAPLAESVALDPLVGHPADFHVFQKFIERCKDLPALSTAVVWPLSEVALGGAVEAAIEGLIEPTLIGDEAGIKALAAKIGLDIGPYPIIHADSERKAAEVGVAMCRSWQCPGDDEGQPAHRRADEGGHEERHRAAHRPPHLAMSSSWILRPIRARC